MNLLAGRPKSILRDACLLVGTGSLVAAAVNYGLSQRASSRASRALGRDAIHCRPSPNSAPAPIVDFHATKALDALWVDTRSLDEFSRWHMPRALHLTASDDGVPAAEALRLLDAAAQQNVSALLLYGRGPQDVARLQGIAAGLTRCGIRQPLILQDDAERAEKTAARQEEAPQ